MNSIRVIPRLEIKAPNLVKGINLEGLRVLGLPDQFARLYYEEGADELIYMDMVASLYGRNCLLDVVAEAASRIFIPLTVGGGLRSIEDIRAVLRAGADKVALNTAAIQRPGFIREAAETFGSSTIVVSIEAMRLPTGRYEALTDGGREKTGVDAVEWAEEVARQGAGEILLTSIQREGTGKGFDLELIRAIAPHLDIPVIAHGGAGTTRHVIEAVEAGADAVALSALLHYESFERLTPAESAGPAGSLPRKVRCPAGMTPTAIPALKRALAAEQIPCRPPPDGEKGAP